MFSGVRGRLLRHRAGRIQQSSHMRRMDSAEAHAALSDRLMDRSTFQVLLPERLRDSLAVMRDPVLGLSEARAVQTVSEMSARAERAIARAVGSLQRGRDSRPVLRRRASPSPARSNLSNVVRLLDVHVQNLELSELDDAFERAEAAEERRQLLAETRQSPRGGWIPRRGGMEPGGDPRAADQLVSRAFHSLRAPAVAAAPRPAPPLPTAFLANRALDEALDLAEAAAEEDARLAELFPSRWTPALTPPPTVSTPTPPPAVSTPVPASAAPAVLTSAVSSTLASAEAASALSTSTSAEAAPSMEAAAAVMSQLERMGAWLPDPVLREPPARSFRPGRRDVLGNEVVNLYPRLVSAREAQHGRETEHGRGQEQSRAHEHLEWQELPGGQDLRGRQEHRGAQEHLGAQEQRGWQEPTRWAEVRVPEGLSDAQRLQFEQERRELAAVDEAVERHKLRYFGLRRGEGGVEEVVREPSLPELLGKSSVKQRILRYHWHSALAANLRRDLAAAALGSGEARAELRREDISPLLLTKLICDTAPSPRMVALEALGTCAEQAQPGDAAGLAAARSRLLGLPCAASPAAVRSVLRAGRSEPRLLAAYEAGLDASLARKADVLAAMSLQVTIPLLPSCISNPPPVSAAAPAS
jgi:hypothetical protein